MAMEPIKDCASTADLEAWLLDFAEERGFESGRYVHIGHGAYAAAALERRPLRFLSTQDNDLDPWRAGDPAILQVVDAFDPFAWSTKDDPILSNQQRMWLRIERARGVHEGVGIPVQDYVSGPAYVSLFGGDTAASSMMNDAAQREMVSRAIGLHQRAKELIAMRPGSAGALSDREVSCLRHAATGASLTETATILGIAPRTVELHFARATRKLGAANRINAVAVAIGTGLIHV